MRQLGQFRARVAGQLTRKIAHEIAQATLGSKVTVQTLDDKKVTIAIPAGTPSGRAK